MRVWLTSDLHLGHGKLQDADRENESMLTRELGVDANDYRPVNFEEIAADMEPRGVRFRERRERFMQSGQDGGEAVT